MKCHRAQQHMMAYHDGELPAGMRRTLRKHLESCTECTRLLERLGIADLQASSAAGGVEMVSVPPPDDRYWESFTPRVLDRIEEDAATRAPERPPRRRRWGLMIPRMAPAFSIALVVVVAAGLFLKMGHRLAEPKNERLTIGTTPGKTTPAAEAEAPEVTPEETTNIDNGSAFRSLPEGEPAGKPPEKGSVIRPEPVTGQQTADLKAQAPLTEKKGAGPKSLETTAAVKDKILPVKPSLAKRLPSPEMQQNAVEKAEVTAKAEAVEPVKKLLADKQSGTDSAGRGDRDGGDQIQKAAAGGDQEPSVLTKEETAVPGQPPAKPADRPGGVVEEREAIPLPSTPAAATEESGQGAGSAVISTPGEPTEKSVGAEPEREIDEAQGPSEAATESLAPESPLYNGPEDQLVHAQTLADQMKFPESEQVLKDLISRNPPPGVLEEASILLVKVLSSQNRVDEARQVLDNAKVQFPTSEAIQTFELKQEGEGSGN